jgi:hypothetical protein
MQIGKDNIMKIKSNLKFISKIIEYKFNDDSFLREKIDESLDMLNQIIRRDVQKYLNPANSAEQPSTKTGQPSIVKQT